MRMSTSSRATSQDTTSSPTFMRMPRTPAAERPMGRTSSSEKRMVVPLRLTMKMSSSPLVWMTRTSSSLGLRLMAMMPSRRELSYSLISVFLTWPFLVAKNR